MIFVQRWKIGLDLVSNWPGEHYRHVSMKLSNSVSILQMFLTFDLIKLDYSNYVGIKYLLQN